jgi:hypothetical protein
MAIAQVVDEAESRTVVIRDVKMLDDGRTTLCMLRAQETMSGKSCCSGDRCEGTDVLKV